MQKKSDDITGEVANRVQQNAHNLPITRIAIAGLLGAGVVALLSRYDSKHRR